jgi:hypothetical protein
MGLLGEKPSVRLNRVQTPGNGFGDMQFDFSPALHSALGEILLKG